MSVYPNVAARSRIRRINNLDTEISDGGILRGQDLSAAAQYRITLEHPLITVSEVGLLQGFYTNNLNTVITTQALADGHTYDCLLLHEPEISDDDSPSHKTVRQTLIGSRNPLVTSTSVDSGTYIYTGTAVNLVVT